METKIAATPGFSLVPPTPDRRAQALTRPSVDDQGNLTLFPIESATGKIEDDKDWRLVDGPSVPFRVGPFASIDFESYYTKKYSLQAKGKNQISPWEYVTHKAFNAYLVAIEWWDGVAWKRWVGHPANAPWQGIAGIPWVSHNASFDELVYRRLMSDGIVPRVMPDIWNCTADLAAYMQFPRGLEFCAPLFLGEVADKTVRAKMKGGGADGDEIRDYAARDARQCAWIWALNHHRWPALESFLSREIRRAGYQGVYADQEMLKKAKTAMRRLQIEVMQKIPWAHNKKVGGTKGITIECAKRGIPVPPSLSLDDPDTEAWQKRYDKEGWLDNIRLHTKAVQMEAHCTMMMSRTRKDGTIPFELIYRKAPHTARWQSGGGLRMQNLDKDDLVIPATPTTPEERYNPRWYIHSRPEHVFGIADLSQIEPRVLNWDVGDMVFVEACAKGASPYDAHAVSTMGYKPLIINGKPQKLKNFNMGLYALAKARVLALGYQAGPPKFVEMARVMAGIVVFEDEQSYCPNITEDQDKWQFYKASQIRDRVERNDLEGWTIFPPATESVYDFRNKSPLIADPKTGAWARANAALAACVGGDHFVELPNGEVIRYYDVRESKTYDPIKKRNNVELTAWVIKNSKNPEQKKYLYGGKLIENRTQRISRDVLADIKGRVALIDRKRLKIRWSVHDELICEMPRRDSKFLFEAMLHEMHTAPIWAKGLPIAAEGQIIEHYIK